MICYFRKRIIVLSNDVTIKVCDGFSKDKYLSIDTVPVI